MTIPTCFVIPAFALLFVLALAVPMAAQKPAASASGTPVFFRNGYQVPAGKSLLIEDVSVMCGAVAALPFLAGNVTSGDFEKYGISGTAKFGIHYAPADCPEALDGENSAPGSSMSSEPCRPTAPTPSRLRAKGDRWPASGRVVASPPSPSRAES